MAGGAEGFGSVCYCYWLVVDGADFWNRWDKSTFDVAKKEREIIEAEYRPGFREQPTRERTSIAEQARSLLKGDSAWRSTPKGDQWENVGEEVEVETNVDVMKATKA